MRTKLDVYVFISITIPLVDGLIVHDGIIHPVVSASVVT